MRTCEECNTLLTGIRSQRFCCANHQMQSARRRYRERGLCARCNKPTTGRTCVPCRDKFRAMQNRRNQWWSHWRWVDGICGTCGKRPRRPGEGTYLCTPCLAKQRVKIAKQKGYTNMDKTGRWIKCARCRGFRGSRIHDKRERLQGHHEFIEPVPLNRP